jgi:hypothetical protein
VKKIAASIVVVLLACGCRAAKDPGSIASSPLAPSAATAAGPRPPNGSGTISGHVVGIGPGGKRPLAGALINAFVDQGSFGYSYWWAHGRVQTDADGGYELTDLPQGATVTFQAAMEGYVQQCAAPAVLVQAGLTVDLQLVPIANRYASSADAPPAAPGYRVISGTVYETTAAGRQPVAGASVDFEPIIDFPAAGTIADDAGRYVLCGVSDARSADLGAGAHGRIGWLTVPAGQTSGADIEIK